MREIPKQLRGTYDRAIKGKASYAGAVKAKCLECCNFEDVRTRVGACTVRMCPLWAYRPYRPTGEGRQARRKPATHLGGPDTTQKGHP